MHTFVIDLRAWKANSIIPICDGPGILNLHFPKKISTSRFEKKCFSFPLYALGTWTDFINEL